MIPQELLDNLILESMNYFLKIFSKYITLVLECNILTPLIEIDNSTLGD
jgi:hypothetical protein